MDKRKIVLKTARIKGGKEKLFALLMCAALILPLAPVWAQEEDEGWQDTSTETNYQDDIGAAANAAAETAAQQAAPKAEPQKKTEATAPKAAPKTSGKSAPLKLPKIDGAKTVNSAFNTIVGYISQIGGIFGKTAGTRIGGTSVSAIVMLVIAKMIQDRGPSWLRWVLYLSGGTMVAGSGANIMQSLMRLF